MRERPEGSKRWELRAYAGRDNATGKPRQVSRVFRGGKREANHALDALVAEVRAGKHVGTAANFKTLAAEFLRHVKRTKELETYESYRIKLEHTILPALGEIKLASLTAHDLDELYESLEGQGQASTTIEHVHNVISGALTQAIKWGWITVNVAKSATPPKAVPKARIALGPDEIARLIHGALTVLKDPDLAVMIYLLCLVGGRRGEACGFQWGDVDWERQAIRVQRQIAPTPGGQRVKPPKGGKTRIESIGPAGVQILIGYQAMLRDRLGEQWTPKPTGWLISPDGGTTPIRARGVTVSIGRLGAKLDAPIDSHPHDFRRFSVTQLIHGGVDLKTIQDRHGHASLATTELYALPVPESDQAAAALMGELLTSAGALLLPSETTGTKPDMTPVVGKVAP